MVICIVIMVSLILALLPQPTNTILLGIIIAAAIFLFLSFVYFIAKFMIAINREVLGIRERADIKL